MIYKGPVKEIPQELLDSYTMNMTIPVLEWYWDQPVQSDLVWSEEFVERFLIRFTKENILNKHGLGPYKHASLYLLEAFSSYPITGKSLAVLGTQTPWIEAMAINHRAQQVTTIDYNLPTCLHSAIATLAHHDFETRSPKFDCIVTYSSIEHSGLGRYGDLLDPDGDLKTMNAIYNSLDQDGLLFWGAPVGKDALVWNAHRIYGPRRLPLMFKDFEILEWFGFPHDSMKNSQIGAWDHQPVIVLRKGEQSGLPRMTVDNNELSHETGHCYSIRFPKYYMPFDSEEDPRGSGLTMYENDIRLPAPHSSYKEISGTGLGRYCHWYDTLYFSTSDNSDPRTNGNVYSINFT